MNTLFSNLTIEERLNVIIEFLYDYKMLQLFRDSMEYAGGSLYTSSDFDNWEDFLEKWNILNRVVDSYKNPESYE